MPEDSGQAGVLTFQEGLMLVQREIVRWADFEYDTDGESDWQAVEASKRVFAIYDRVRRVEKAASNDALTERISSSEAKVGGNPMLISPQDDTYSEVETATRREAMLRTLLATPHKPQRPIKGRRVESRGKRAEKSE